MKCGLLQASWLAVEPPGSKSFIIPNLIILLLRVHAHHPLNPHAPCTSFITATIWKRAKCPTIGECLCEVGHTLRDYGGAIRNYAYEDSRCRLKKALDIECTLVIIYNK